VWGLFLPRQLLNILLLLVVLVAALLAAVVVLAAFARLLDFP
jgi:hypothetical protein